MHERMCLGLPQLGPRLQQPCHSQTAPSIGKEMRPWVCPWKTWSSMRCMCEASLKTSQAGANTQVHYRWYFFPRFCSKWQIPVLSDLKKPSSRMWWAELFQKWENLSSHRDVQRSHRQARLPWKIGSQCHRASACPWIQWAWILWGILLSTLFPVICGEFWKATKARMGDAVWALQDDDAWLLFIQEAHSAISHFTTTTIK